MKDFLKELAYQRVPDEDMQYPSPFAGSDFPADAILPSSIDVAYNGYHGDQRIRDN
jgi:hypothetical protein